MKKGDVIECSIEDVSFPARGTAHLPGAGRTIYVKNTVPGQRVRCRVLKVRSGRAEAWPLEVLEKAPGEIEPDCRHFGSCGGCVYRQLPYEDQLKLKEHQVKKLLEGLVPEDRFEGIEPSPSVFGYRNKMEFSFGDEYMGGPLALGMHRQNSYYDIVTVEDCRIINDDFKKILKTVLDVCRRFALAFYHRSSHKGYLRHLVVRGSSATGDLLVDLVTSTQIARQEEEALEKELARSLLKLNLEGRICGILHTHNDSLADAVNNQETSILYGQNCFYEELLGLKFKVTIFSFFQTNPRGAELLYRRVQEYIGETRGKNIYDLYSGTGTIAQILSPVAEHVTGVEIVEEAVEAARENARLNHLDNCSFIAGDVLKVLDELTEKPDLIVLDPPREGVNPHALRKIISYQVPHMVYVSCKPTSLQRDLGELMKCGYRPQRCSMIDMFPGTASVETICSLSRQEA